MPYFKIKTHRVGQTYTNPHFFILNKGLNSGKPLQESCPNCYVITTPSEEDKNTLFHLTMMLQIGGFYKPFLKGSVILFITIKDCSSVLQNGLNTNKTATELKKGIQKLQLISNQEQALKQMIKKIVLLKISYAQAFVNENANQRNTTT